jgi:hypothetical protein
MRAKSSLLLLLAALLVISGCGNSGAEKDKPKVSTKPVVIAVGDCYKGGQVGDDAVGLAKQIKTKKTAALADDPIWTDKVDCAQDHRLYVYGLVGLPKELGQQVTSYAKLLDTESELYGQVRTAVNRACSLTLPGVRKALKKTDLKLQITPAVNADIAQLTFNPVPYPNWQDGQRHFACLMTLNKAGTQTLADFMTAQGQTSSLHLCYDPNSQPVACTEKHTMESAAVITANEAVAERQLPDSSGFVNGTLKVNADVWDTLDRVCTTFIRANSKLPRGLTGVTSLYNSQWPIQGTEDYAFYCDATSPYSTPPGKMTRTTGSIFNR